MVNWTQLQNATSPDNKPTPGWLFHEIVQDVRTSPKDTPEVAEYLMQCVCSDQLNIQLKAVLCIRHVAAEDITFQKYMQSCPGAIKILEDIAAPPIVPQARSLEPQEVKTVRDATKAALESIRTPHTVEKSTEAAGLKQRIQGFGNFEPPQEENAAQKHGVAGQVAEFVGDSIGDMVDDFREKGAVGALKDATIDALDLVLDGVDAVWCWVAGKNEQDGPRICQPVAQAPGAMGALPYAGGTLPYSGGASSAFAPPVPTQPTSASNHYAAAFGQGVVGANNPVMINSGPTAPLSAAAPTPSAPGASAASTTLKDEAPKPTPAPSVDLLSMDEPQQEPAQSGVVVADLLGDEISSPTTGGQPPQQGATSTGGLLDF